jgi:signal transduction histidine kinase
MKLAHRLLLQYVIVVIALNVLIIAVVVQRLDRRLASDTQAAPIALNQAEAHRIVTEVRTDIALAGSAALLVTIVVTLVFARNVSQPITKLRDIARGLANHEGSIPPAPLSAPGEVGELAVALSQLSVQLDALEKTRRDFVANVSHELRTPLTIVGGFAETLVEDDDVPIENRRQFAKTILDNTRRMQRIVDDLLDLSRIESGGWIPRPVDTDLRGATAEAAALVRDAAERKGVTLNVQVANEAARACLDRTALRQILTNLSENAIRHTPTGGSVTMFTLADRGGIWVGVRDTGEGIAPEHLSRVFERFYRVDTGRSRDSGGTGLGLSIVRHLAEAHGGTTQATSDVGRGTTIRVFSPDKSDKIPADR